MESLFKNDKTYQPTDPEMTVLGDENKLNQWRHKGMGPPYYKVGRKVLYSGADLNAWLAAQRVEPAAA